MFYNKNTSEAGMESTSLTVGKCCLSYLSPIQPASYLHSREKVSSRAMLASCAKYFDTTKKCTGGDERVSTFLSCLAPSLSNHIDTSIDSNTINENVDVDTSLQVLPSFT